MTFSKTDMLSCIILFLVAAGCAKIHTYGPYSGIIIDNETKKPI